MLDVVLRVMIAENVSESLYSVNSKICVGKLHNLVRFNVHFLKFYEAWTF